MAQGFWEAVEGASDRTKIGKTTIIGAAIIIAAIIVVSIRFFSTAALGDEVSLERSEQEAEVEPSSQVKAADEGHEAATGETPPQQSAAKLAVYVSGAVCAPDVYELPDGSRITDAIIAAGGFSDDAQTESLNLAQKISDGEHIHVPHIGEDVTAVGDYANGPSDGAGVSDVDGMVDINTATADQLEGLSGIGPATARKIIEEREANGPFSSVDDLARVSGIGQKKIENLRGSACV